MQLIKASLIIELAHSQGLTIVGIQPFQALEEDEKRLKFWQDQQFQGDLSYMSRDSKLFVSPQEILGSAGSIISLVLPYDLSPRPPLPNGHGKIARYAWGKDYHKVLSKHLKEFCKALKSNLPVSTQIKVFTDAVPLLERAYARNSGLGFVGKNTMLIQPKIGSFNFIAEVLLGARVDLEQPVSSMKDHIQKHYTCGTCRRCQASCPTQALSSAYQLDARKCISYLTIEKRGLHSIWERRAIADWIFGCDICQDVCPFNYSPLKTSLKLALPEFGPAQGVGASLELSAIFSITNQQQFVSRFSGTALTRCKREGLIRNALAVAANTNAVHLSSSIECLALEDSSDVIRATAWWSLKELNPQQDFSRATKDPSLLVKNEILQLQQTDNSLKS